MEYRARCLLLCYSSRLFTVGMIGFFLWISKRAVSFSHLHVYTYSMVADDMAEKCMVGTGINGNDMVGKDIYMAQCTDRRVRRTYQMVRDGWSTKYRESCLVCSHHA